MFSSLAVPYRVGGGGGDVAGSILYKEKESKWFSVYYISSLKKSVRVDWKKADQSVGSLSVKVDW